MDKQSRIYIAGHTGMAGSSILRKLRSEGYENIVTRTHHELDLINQQEVRNFFHKEKIDYVVLAAAKVGGIYANSVYRGEFIYENLAIQNNVIHESYRAGIQRLLFLGSSCIYPRLSRQPMREEYLLAGPLEPTNEPYAVAKIAGIKLCEAYNQQYGVMYRSVMPTNLYGPNDNYDLENCHLIAALIRKFHLAKLAKTHNWSLIEQDLLYYGKISDAFMTDLNAIDTNSRIFFWGTGTVRREFLHIDDMADACVFLMQLSDERYISGLRSEAFRLTPSSLPSQNKKLDYVPSFYNIGTGKDHTVKELAEIVAAIVGFKGEIAFDSSKPDGMPRKQLDVSRLRGLGWESKISLTEGIRQTYENYLKKSKT